jgi:hypothetical protein
MFKYVCCKYVIIQGLMYVVNMYGYSFYKVQGSLTQQKRPVWGAFMHDH